jgi:LysM domain/Bacterial SH3 domain
MLELHMPNIFGSVFHAISSGVKHLEHGVDDVKKDVAKDWGSAMHAARSGLHAGERFGDDVKKDAVNDWDNVKQDAVNDWDNVKKDAANDWDNIKQDAVNDWDNVKKDAVNDWDNVKKDAANDWDTVKKDAANDWDTVKKDAVNGWDTVERNAVNGWDNVKKDAVNDWDNVKKDAVNDWDTVKKDAVNGWDNVKQDAVNDWDTVKKDAVNDWDTVKKDAVNDWDTVKKDAVKGWDIVKKDAVKGWDIVKKDAVKGWDTVKKDAVKGWDNVKKDAVNAWDTATGFLDGRSEDALLDRSVNELHYNGDQTTLNLSASGQFSIPEGAQAQGADSITIKQVGGRNPPGTSGQSEPLTYQVTLTETQQGGVNFTPSGSLGQQIRGYAGAQVNLGFANTATVTVDNKQDAERVAKTLARVLASNTIGEGVEEPLTTPVPDILHNPIVGSIEGHSDLIQRGVQDLLSLTHIDRISGSDLNFLKTHLTSYSTTLTLDGNLQGNASLTFAQVSQIPGLSKIPGLNALDLNASVTLKGDDAVSLTRTITLATPGKPATHGKPATPGKPATVAYTLANQATGTVSGGLRVGAQLPFLPNNLPGAKLPIQPLRVTAAGGQYTAGLLNSVTATYNLSPQDLGDPELALTREDRWDKPNELSATSQRQFNVSEYGAIPGPDSRQYTYTDTATIVDPAKFGDRAVAGFLWADELDERGAILSDEKRLGPDATATATNTVSTLSVAPTKIALDPSIQLSEDVRVWLGVNANVTTDNIDSSRTTTYAQMPHVPQRRPAPQPAGPHGQYVVTPLDGLNIRDAPSTSAAKEGAIFSGSFVQATGKTSTDASGNTWFQVSGTDMNDDPVEGWVEARYLAQHPQGALRGTGRIEPSQGPPAYRPVVVQPGETVFGIAQENGVPVSALENSNRQHIIDPNLIFPGDVIYVPTGEPQRGA